MAGFISVGAKRQDWTIYYPLAVKCCIEDFGRGLWLLLWAVIMAEIWAMTHQPCLGWGGQKVPSCVFIYHLFPPETSIRKHTNGCNQSTAAIDRSTGCAHWLQADYLIKLQIYSHNESVLNRCVHILGLALYSSIKHTHTQTHLRAHTFPSCFRCCTLKWALFWRTRRHCVSVGGAHTEATGQQNRNMFAFPLRIHTEGRSSVSTFFKGLVVSFNTTPLLPLDLCVSVCVCLCWRTTPLAVLYSIVRHFLWTSAGMQGWPVWKYGRFHESHYRRWKSKMATKFLGDCLQTTPEQTKILLLIIIKLFCAKKSSLEESET